jgi:hypothetical protein
MRDPLDLLTPHPAGLEPATKRHVFEATRSALRRRRTSRARTAAALAAALAAGLLLFAVIPAAPRIERPTTRQEEEPTSAVALEWEALDRPDESKRLYRDAGERYVREGDLAGALRCYGGSLDAGTAEDLEADDGDDFLLMAIKIARKKESER